MTAVPFVVIVDWSRTASASVTLRTGEVPRHARTLTATAIDISCGSMVD